MSLIGDTLILSRLQFTLTTMFHIIWPVLTVGLSIFLVIIEILWLRTKDDDYYRHLRFWSKLLLINFSIGVATGLVMEFEFGTNWQPFTEAAGGFFGNMLGFEGTLAFMLEAGFLGIMMFGWEKVPRGIHLLSTILVAFGGSLSAFWIIVANSWMQTPAGGHFVNGRFVLDNFAKALFNPDMATAAPHMWIACIETTVFVVGGISAWYLLRKRNSSFFLKTFKIAAAVAMIVTPLQIYLGDAQGLGVFHDQPAKLAAMEAHWRTNPPGEPASFSVLAWPDRAQQRNLFDLKIPYLLSLLETRTLTGQVRGLASFPRSDQPPVVIPFYGFRLMVLIGVLLFALMVWTIVAWLKGRLSADSIGSHRWLLKCWIAALPLGYLAVEAGWLTREEGRQPWIIYGVLRTQDAYSRLPAWAVDLSFFGLLVIYAILGALFVVFVRRFLQKGPDLLLVPPPGPGISPSEGK